ncbi:MAG: ribonuclease H-like domain-containing protein [Candidatus Abawacabacteria bacterium]|nr:ribonuclease H-like domain-containing protein [Candidatus Abawacabacteria bacterium]
MLNHSYLVLDLETKKLLFEVGGKQNLGQLGISVAGVFDSREQQYFCLREEAIKDLVPLLNGVDRIVGFNTEGFDFDVLQPYIPDLNLKKLPSLDILSEIAKITGHRVSMEKVAQATLGIGKSADGLMAIKWYHEGNYVDLEKYCLQDVEVTNKLYLYGLEHGELKFPLKDSNEIKTIKVNFHFEPELTLF